MTDMGFTVNSPALAHALHELNNEHRRLPAPGNRHWIACNDYARCGNAIGVPWNVISDCCGPCSNRPDDDGPDSVPLSNTEEVRFGAEGARIHRRSR